MRGLPVSAAPPLPAGIDPRGVAAASSAVGAMSTAEEAVHQLLAELVEQVARECDQRASSSSGAMSPAGASRARTAGSSACDDVPSTRPSSASSRTIPTTATSSSFAASGGQLQRPITPAAAATIVAAAARASPSRLPKSPRPAPAFGQRLLVPEPGTASAARAGPLSTLSPQLQQRPQQQQLQRQPQQQPLPLPPQQQQPRHEQQRSVSQQQAPPLPQTKPQQQKSVETPEAVAAAAEFETQGPSPVDKGCSACDDVLGLEALEVDGPADEWLSPPTSSMLISRADHPDGPSDDRAASPLMLRSHSWQEYVHRMSPEKRGAVVPGTTSPPPGITVPLLGEVGAAANGEAGAASVIATSGTPTIGAPDASAGVRRRSSGAREGVWTGGSLGGDAADTAADSEAATAWAASLRSPMATSSYAATPPSKGGSHGPSRAASCGPTPQSASRSASSKYSLRRSTAQSAVSPTAQQEAELQHAPQVRAQGEPRSKRQSQDTSYSGPSEGQQPVPRPARRSDGGGSLDSRTVDWQAKRSWSRPETAPPPGEAYLIALQRQATPPQQRAGAQRTSSGISLRASSRRSTGQRVDAPAAALTSGAAAAEFAAALQAAVGEMDRSSVISGAGSAGPPSVISSVLAASNAERATSAVGAGDEGATPVVVKAAERTVAFALPPERSSEPGGASTIAARRAAAVSLRNGGGSAGAGPETSLQMQPLHSHFDIPTGKQRKDEDTPPRLCGCVVM